MAARDRRMGVLNELIGAVSWTFNLCPGQIWGTVCSVAIEYGDIRTQRRMTWSGMRHVLIFVRVGQVYQVFCMGGSVDRTCT